MSFDLVICELVITKKKEVIASLIYNLKLQRHKTREYSVAIL